MAPALRTEESEADSVLVLILTVPAVKRTSRLPLLALPSCPLAVDAPHLDWHEPQGTSLITHNGIFEQLPKDVFQIYSHTAISSLFNGSSD